MRLRDLRCPRALPSPQLLSPSPSAPASRPRPSSCPPEFHLENAYASAEIWIARDGSLQQLDRLRPVLIHVGGKAEK